MAIFNCEWFTQVKDQDYDTPPILSAAVAEDCAWNILGEQTGKSAVPVTNKDGSFLYIVRKEQIIPSLSAHWG